MPNDDLGLVLTEKVVLASDNIWNTLPLVDDVTVTYHNDGQLQLL